MPETVLVEQKAPLALRVAGVAVVLVMAGVLLVWGIDLGQRIFGASKGESAPSIQKQLEQAEADLVKLTAERDALLAGKAKAVKGEITPLQQDTAGLAAATLENARLAADLELVESLLPPVAAGTGLVIQGMQARMEAPRQLHYAVLLGYGARKGGSAQFSGRLHLSVTVSKDGKQSVLEFPDAQGAERYTVTVLHRQRVDGTLELPDGAHASAIQVSLWDKDKMIAKEAISVKEFIPLGKDRP